MNLALDEDLRMIRDAAASTLAELSPSAAVRKAGDTALGFDPEVWQRIGSELGWCGTAIDEAHGGLGLGALAQALILEQMGRHLLCAPYFASVCLAAPLLTEIGGADAKKKYLSAIADGSLQASAALPGADGWTTELGARGAQRVTLSGYIDRVPDGMSAAILVLPARDEKGALGFYAVEHGAPGVSVQPLDTWDRTRRFADLELQDVPAQRVDTGGVPERALALARVYLAAEQLGGAQACLDLTVAYVATRKQFGRTISSFQAVKHRCAEMMVRVEALRSLVYGAAASGEPLDAAAAKAQASDTFFFCAQEAVQLHGGVGFTWEFDPQLYFKRAQASSHWLGTAGELRARIADRLLGKAA